MSNDIEIINLDAFFNTKDSKSLTSEDTLHISKVGLPSVVTPVTIIKDRFTLWVGALDALHPRELEDGGTLTTSRIGWRQTTARSTTLYEGDRNTLQPGGVVFVAK